jgi:hypothetical protein
MERISILSDLPAHVAMTTPCTTFSHQTGLDAFGKELGASIRLEPLDRERHLLQHLVEKKRRHTAPASPRVRYYARIQLRRRASARSLSSINKDHPSLIRLLCCGDCGQREALSIKSTACPIR